MTANLAMGENKRCTPVKNLLPGIVDAIVLDKIVPKLEWKDFYTLSSVSCAWYNAIRSRRVFDARVLSHASEIFVVCWTANTIALYSMRDNSWHKLPRVADVFQGQDRIPTSAQCIAMDGKVYVLGGTIASQISSKVFVFDLAGQGRWQQCASMKQQREGFGTAVMDGKIYVFGGLGYGSASALKDRNMYGGKPWSTLRSSESLRSAEVYDPKEDTWSPIRPMATCRFGQLVTPVGEELFIFGGTSFDDLPNIIESLEAYHPFKDEWRVLQRSWNQPQCGLVFTVHGSVFSIEADAIRKYNVHGNSWTHVCSFSLAALIPVEYDIILTGRTPDAVLVVDDELITLVSCFKGDEDGPLGLCLFESTGLCSEDQKISWKLRAITFEEVGTGAHYYFVQKL